MRLTIRRGRGYVSADENKRSEAPIGVIPIDSIFSPVTRVAYSVEPARVGQRTDYDRLTLEVETNGAIDPQTALLKAATMLRDDLTAIFLSDVGGGDLPGTPPEPGVDEAEPQEPDMLIDDLELGVRSLNC